MAGHSKWANIQHRKGRQDAARSKLFSKLAKEITVAAKMGDPDPEKNPRDTPSGKLEIHCQSYADYVKKCGWSEISRKIFGACSSSSTGWRMSPSLPIERR